MKERRRHVEKNLGSMLFYAVSGQILVSLGVVSGRRSVAGDVRGDILDRERRWQGWKPGGRVDRAAASFRGRRRLFWRTLKTLSRWRTAAVRSAKPDSRSKRPRAAFHLFKVSYCDQPGHYITGQRLLSSAVHFSFHRFRLCPTTDPAFTVGLSWFPGKIFI